jgi:hypothetical protein
MESGKFARIDHDLFADLFPPGEPDVGAAREACWQFARQHGCRALPGPLSGQGELWFVKAG